MTEFQSHLESTQIDTEFQSHEPSEIAPCTNCYRNPITGSGLSDGSCVPDIQERFGSQAAKAIGFEFDRGRLDVTHHPFCTEAGPDDCRITTRYDSDFFNMAFFGILHEAGHGIYDQGLRKSYYGLGPGHYLSLGIHESQSRLSLIHISEPTRRS